MPLVRLVLISFPSGFLSALLVLDLLNYNESKLAFDMPIYPFSIYLKNWTGPHRLRH